MRIRISFGPLKSLLLAGIASGAMMAAATAASAQTGGFTYTPIVAPGGHATYATGINDAGEIVGYSNGVSFTDIGGSLTTVTNSGMPTLAYGINASGQISGNDAPNGSNYFGFIDTNGSFTSVGDMSGIRGINDSGTVVGYVYNVGYEYGVIDTNGKFTTFYVPGTLNAYAYGINDAGQVVGTAQTGGLDVGFLYNGGSITTFSVPGAAQTFAYGINDSGQIAGYDITGGVTQGFLDTGGTFTTISVPGATLAEALGLNDSGDIVGYYTDASGTHGFLATPDGSPGPTDEIPLPVTGGTLPGTMVLLGWVGRRLVRRRTA